MVIPSHSLDNAALWGENLEFNYALLMCIVTIVTSDDVTVTIVILEVIRIILITIIRVSVMNEIWQ